MNDPPPLSVAKNKRSMGFMTVVIENETGRRIGEEVIVPSSIFPQLTDERVSCLRFVDPYGNTTFNRPQMPFVLADLLLLKSELPQDQSEHYVEPIEAMAKICGNGVHLYLKFIED